MTSLDNKTGQQGFREKPDGDTAPAAEVGWYLQRERETLGHSLTDVASELRVDPNFLHALEQGELHHQLSWTYVLSYVRSYSDYLGFEPAPVIKHYKKILADETGLTMQSSTEDNWPFNEVRARAAIATFAGVVGMMGLAGLAFTAHDATVGNTSSEPSKTISDILSLKKDKTSYQIKTKTGLEDLPDVAIRQVPLDKSFDEQKSQAAVQNLQALSLARLAAVSEN